ncbi:Bug family tripartite tricarboxylate transporter substrate binding protein [Jiella sonneratiae]|uniref:Tripartite tricarboxylate transporter substrate binding protein n=1 Tax=Jiella sonneratiae TaxID=2816856 RepID=A0ABS3JAA8_9HYPH|nr:tripartite tricarboxylate transporter substrate binding protein [Jiella sonneratiae]MBO0906067.1 tripartite tricarboxylate transporter substrate binding protein [Jiella sonneratiae]
MKLVLTAVIAAALCGGAGVAAAQDYPARPIQVVVPYSAGGGTDLSARIMAEVFQKHLDGSTMIIRNQPGGGGAIGTSAVLHARPDGYTLGTGSQGPLALLPHYGGTDYKLDDVEFIALMGRNLQILLGCSGAPFKNFDEFLAYAKENPGKVQVGNSGAGGANQIAMQAFAEKAGIKIADVPFGGASEAMTACVGGHIDATISTPAEAKAQVDAKAVTPIFIMEDKRIPDYPDTPTAVEKGIDFTWSSWKGIIGPKGMPDDVKKTLQQAFEETFNDPEFLKRMKDMGEFVEYRDAEGYEKLARKDSKEAEAVIRDLGMYGMNAK